jgi:ABC-2 type transport system permease protein
VSLRITLATAGRVIRQIRRDPRTLALILVVPPALLTLFKYVFAGQEETFNRVGPPMVGLFPFISMFLVTSIAMLRERTTGTLERLMSLPLGKLDLLLGYGIAFAALAVLQASLTSLVAFGGLGLETDGPVWLIVALATGNALLGMALGLFLSAFAETEFQAVQFMPAFVLPQILLCGLLIPRDEMAAVLEWLSTLLPLTYAYDALARATADELDAHLAVDVVVVAGAIVGALVLGATTLRRRTP